MDACLFLFHLVPDSCKLVFHALSGIFFRKSPDRMMNERRTVFPRCITQIEIEAYLSLMLFYDFFQLCALR